MDNGVLQFYLSLILTLYNKYTDLERTQWVLAAENSNDIKPCYCRKFSSSRFVVNFNPTSMDLTPGSHAWKNDLNTSSIPLRIRNISLRSLLRHLYSSEYREIIQIKHSQLFPPGSDHLSLCIIFCFLLFFVKHVKQFVYKLAVGIDYFPVDHIDNDNVLTETSWDILVVLRLQYTFYFLSIK